MNLTDLVDHIDLPETDIAERAWDLAGRRTRRRRTAAVAASVALVLAVVGASAVSLRGEVTSSRPAGTDPTPTAPETSGVSPTIIDHDPLTDHEFAVAVAVAHSEIERLHLSRRVTSVTAAVGERTGADSNTGHECVSEAVLHVRLIGDFDNIPHGGGMPGQSYEPTSAVLLTADPQSEQVCHVGVGAGEWHPAPDSVVLFVPELSGRTLQGDSVSVADYAGRPLVVFVWASFCKPCRDVAADLSHWSDATGTPVLGVDTRDLPTAGSAFEEQYRITYPSLVDLDGRMASRLVGQRSGIPLTLVLDAQGVVKTQILGAFDVAETLNAAGVSDARTSP